MPSDARWTRRDFLRRTSLALAAGLVVGPEVMEAFERLTHRKVFVSAWPNGLPQIGDRVERMITISGSTYETWERVGNQYSFRRQFVPSEKSWWGSAVWYPDVPALPAGAVLGTVRVS